MATTLTIAVLADVAKAVQGIDSVDKRTQSWGDTMKGTALALGSAFSIDKIKGFVEGWVNSGLEASRSAKNIKAVFGEASDSVAAWSETAATSFSTTAAEAEQMAAKVGTALVGFGMSHTDAAKASEDLVQRAADVAKVLGVDESEVLGKVESAMRGRTAGIKDYGVQVAAGSSATEILNAFMDQTSQFSGQADTKIGTLKATFGDLSATLGQALVPILMDLIPLVQAVADWAKNNKVPFEIIVFTMTALALAFGIAATAAGIFAVASWAALWPILLIVAGVIALIAVVVLVIKYWSDLVGWFHQGVDAVVGMIDKFQVLILLFGGPLGVAIVAIRHFSDIWGAVKSAIEACIGPIEHLWDIAQKIGGWVGSVASKIPGIGKSAGGGGGAPATAGVAAYGVAPMAAPVFAPTINISGDIGDPMLAGRRIVSALEAWTAANGRRRMAALVGGP